MRSEVREKIESREACENLQRFTCRMNQFSGNCPCALLGQDTCEADLRQKEQDEVIFVPENYSRRESIIANIAATLLNMMSLGIFSRIGSVSKYMHG